MMDAIPAHCLTKKTTPAPYQSSLSLVAYESNGGEAVLEDKSEEKEERREEAMQYRGKGDLLGID